MDTVETANHFVAFGEAPSSERDLKTHLLANGNASKQGPSTMSNGQLRYTTATNNNLNNGLISNGKPESNGKAPASAPAPADKEEERSARQSLIILAAIFLTSLFAMIYVYAMFPRLEESEKQYIKVPFDIEDAKQLGRVLDRYKDLYYLEVMFGVILVYIL